MKCPTCGANAQGKFCAECGTPLNVARCAQCQAKLLPGASYCTQCGTAARSRAGSNTAWYVAGGVIAVAIITLLVPTLRRNSGESSPPPAGPFSGQQTGTPPPLSANMRENADRLFNRIMEARDAGDSAQVRQFAPMAIAAYQESRPLDTDGLYHLSVIQTAAGDPAAGRATADEILQSSPNHLLGLSAAATAARAQNDATGATQYYQRLLDAFTEERSKALPEYQDHGNLFAGLEAEARQFLQK